MIIREDEAVLNLKIFIRLILFLSIAAGLLASEFVLSDDKLQNAALIKDVMFYQYLYSYS